MGVRNLGLLGGSSCLTRGLSIPTWGGGARLCLWASRGVASLLSKADSPLLARGRSLIRLVFLIPLTRPPPAPRCSGVI